MEEKDTQNYIETINELKGEKYLQGFFRGMTTPQLEKLKDYFDNKYYNYGLSLIPDEKYNVLKDILLDRKPEIISQVGAKVGKKEDRIVLPYWLGSMNKIKPNETQLLEKWVRRNPPGEKGYIISDKLDGISGLLTVENGDYTLYTRGKGKEGISIGSDISHLIKYIPTIPKGLKNIAVRGELVIPIEIFNEKFWNEGEKKDGKYSNVRSMIIGLGGAKTYRPGMKYIQFVVYEIIYPSGDEEKPSKQMEKLKDLGFKVVNHSFIEGNLPPDEIREKLLEDFVRAKEKSKFQVDGVIVQSDTKYIRNIKDNPKYAFAFKVTMGEDIVETEIKFVEWNLSKNGKLFPRISIFPVELYGTENNWATGKSAKFIEENSLGPGAIIYYTKGGESIGDVVGIKRPAPEPQMPDIPYHWNKNRVFIYADNPDYEMCIKRIVFFFKTLDIKHVGEAIVTKLYKNGLDTLEKIIRAKPEDFLKIKGFQKTLANKIYKNIHDSLENVEMYKLMAATGLFGEGVGTRKLNELMKNIPDLLTLPETYSRDEILTQIISVKGFSNITAEKIVGGITFFNKFIEDISPQLSFKEKIVPKGVSLTGKKFVFSGFRNKEWEEIISSLGGSVTSAVSKNTDYLVVKDKDDITGKVTKAMSLGVIILDIPEFKELIGIE